MLVYEFEDLARIARNIVRAFETHVEYGHINEESSEPVSYDFRLMSIQYILD